MVCARPRTPAGRSMPPCPSLRRRPVRHARYTTLASRAEKRSRKRSQQTEGRLAQRRTGTQAHASRVPEARSSRTRLGATLHICSRAAPLRASGSPRSASRRPTRRRSSRRYARSSPLVLSAIALVWASCKSRARFVRPRVPTSGQVIPRTRWPSRPSSVSRSMKCSCMSLVRVRRTARRELVKLSSPTQASFRPGPRGP